MRTLFVVSGTNLWSALCNLWLTENGDRLITFADESKVGYGITTSQPRPQPFHQGRPLHIAKLGRTNSFLQAPGKLR
ncbi:hypothetical protein TcWFU_002336 [Taenia crassiceps]|uniref:Uncharacterized protein n=1 Tax=Taenia crassiceps TaxID=6207 RepID=A0ABR4QCY4_9CEST